MSDIPDIYFGCHNCGNFINAQQGQRYWLRHGQGITKKERDTYGILCDECVIQYILNSKKRHIEEIRKKSLEKNT